MHGDSGRRQTRTGTTVVNVTYEERRMATAFGIILADVLLFIVFVCQYRQELGFSVNGAHDLEPPHERPAKTSPRPAAATGPPPDRGRIATGQAAANQVAGRR